MNWSRSTAISLGLATAFPLLYLCGFIPFFFFLQDSPNPPAGRTTEHVLFVVAGFAMAAYFVDYLFYLIHVVARYPGSALRKVGWALAFVLAGPFAMAVYWPINIWRPAVQTQPKSGVGV